MQFDNNYSIAQFFIIEMVILSLHWFMWSWLKTSKQSFEMKSQNMHVKTPQSKSTKKEKSKTWPVMWREHLLLAEECEMKVPVVNCTHPSTERRYNSPFLCQGVSILQGTSPHSMESISFPFFTAFCPQSKGKKMEDRLSPKAQDLVKRTAKVKCTFSDLVVEERKERKRALESKSRKKRFRWRPSCWYWSPRTTCSICWSACDGNVYNRRNRSWLNQGGAGGDV